MPIPEFERLKEIMKHPPTPENMAVAAQAFRDFHRRSGTEGVLVNSRYGPHYPNAIPLHKVSDHLATNPHFFALMQRIFRRS